jgi:hypothetical protein
MQNKTKNEKSVKCVQEIIEHPFCNQGFAKYNTRPFTHIWQNYKNIWHNNQSMLIAYALTINL